MMNFTNLFSIFPFLLTLIFLPNGYSQPQPQHQHCTGPVPDIQNGYVAQGGSLVGNWRGVYCDPGYQLDGISFILCQESGQWSRIQATCHLNSQPAQCRQLPQVSNGYAQTDSYAVGSIATINCNPGFHIASPLVVQCLSSGTWSINSISCQPGNTPQTSCGELPTVANGRFVSNSYEIGSQAFLYCYANFILQGPNSITCQPSGNWSTSVSQCVSPRPTTCGPLPLVVNGTFSASSFEVGSLANLSCQPRFEIQGYNLIICQSNGNWTNPLGVCSPIRRPIICKQLPTITNGIITSRSHSPGSKADIFCNTGFQLEGSNKIQCLQSGEWSPVVSICRPTHQPAGCGQLPQLPDGQVSTNSYAVGSIASLVCNNGYQRQGPDEIYCLQSGRWSEIVSICYPTQTNACGHLPQLPNGNISTNSYALGGIASVICNSGYHLQGQASILCLQSGHWSQIMARCEMVNCGNTPSIENGVFIGYRGQIGNKADIVCNPGYELQGQTSIFCLGSGKWSPIRGTCVATQFVRCGPVPELTNGFIHNTSDVVGSLAPVLCDPGFERRGPQAISCLPSGNWSLLQTTCQSLNCSDNLPTIANGWIARGPTVVGSQRLVQCDLGYQRNGLQYMECNQSRQWSVQTNCEKGEFKNYLRILFHFF